MYDTILVPIELSHKHSGVNAAKIAKKLIVDGGEIILLNVMADIPAFIEFVMPKDVLNKSKERILAELTKIAKDEGIDTNVELRSGHAADSILRVAESHNVDLIIIASHQPGLSNYFLGSTAARVVRHALCPVLVDR
ncbi:MAG: universal stress protein [Hyphomicrobiales bacterium]|nr:universal stress protein [Hyphomicrobiales bacterium]